MNIYPTITGALCAVPDMPHALVTGTERHIGAVQQFRCPDGTRFLDGMTHLTIKCTERGEWTVNHRDCKSTLCLVLKISIGYDDEDPLLDDMVGVIR